MLLAMLPVVYVESHSYNIIVWKLWKKPLNIYFKSWSFLKVYMQCWIFVKKPTEDIKIFSASSWRRLIGNFHRNRHPDLHSDCTSLHSHWPAGEGQDHDGEITKTAKQSLWEVKILDLQLWSLHDTLGPQGGWKSYTFLVCMRSP